jgi:hypothetical protein
VLRCVCQPLRMASRVGAPGSQLRVVIRSQTRRFKHRMSLCGSWELLLRRDHPTWTRSRHTTTSLTYRWDRRNAKRSGLCSQCTAPSPRSRQWTWSLDDICSLLYRFSGVHGLDLFSSMSYVCRLRVAARCSIVIVHVLSP